MGYFDIEISPHMTLEEIFIVKDYKERKLYFNSAISHETIQEYIEVILQYNKEDEGIPIEERKPILFYISSFGGDVDSGVALIDAIEMSETPVYTINTGCLYSMGFLVGLAGHKRFTFKNAKFLMHDGSGYFYDSNSKMQDAMEFQKRVNESIKKYILRKSDLSEEEYDAKLRIEWYLFADEAKEKGFVDYIVGEDCKIDEII